VLARAVDWFIFRAGRYEPLAPGEDGILRSVTFPGLWLDSAALIAESGLRLIATLREGIGSREHAEFVARLARTS
jgi:hypothetical protein